MQLEYKRGKLLSRREIIVLLLLALPLLVTVSTIEAAHWVKGLPSLKLLVVVSLVPWALLARSRVPWWIGHPGAVVAGLVAAFVLGSFTLSGGRGLDSLGSQLGDWFAAVGSKDGNSGSTTMGVALIAITLLTTHATLWLAYRRSLALWAALPGLGVLLVVLTFLQSDYYWYFFMYLLTAAPGIAYRHRGRWSRPGQRAPLLGTLAVGLALMGVTVAAVWQTPAPEGTVMPLTSKFEKQWLSFSERWSALFHGVPDRKQWTSFSPPHDLPMGGVIPIGDEVMFEVKPKDGKPRRWRMRAYETYTGTHWVNDKPPEDTTASEVLLGDYVEELRDRRDVEIDVRVYFKGKTLVTVGEPLAASISSSVEVSPQPSFKLYLGAPYLSYLPPEVESYLESTAGGSGEERGTVPEPLEAGLSAIGFQRIEATTDTDPNQPAQESEELYVTLERVQSDPGPPLALKGKRVLVPPRGYTTRGSLSEATPPDLRADGQDYPRWVTDRHLQLPEEFPETVKKLARELTKDEDNPYDMAEAIRRHLHTLPYSLDVQKPPSGQDSVEFFLLVHRRGFCQNYASAMITMLRHLGVPSRLVVGFAPGIPTEDKGVFEVQSRHYHAWPEVYFPRYGWVEFEPTPSDVQPALESLGVLPHGGLAGGQAPDIPDCDLGLDLNLCDELEDFEGGELIDFLDELEPSPPGEDLSSGGGLGFLSSPWAPLGLGLALAFVAAAVMVGYFKASMSRVGYVTTTYASMFFLGRLAGVGQRAQDTPWEHSSRLTRAFSEQAEVITHITSRFVAVRYGGPAGTPYAADMWGIRSAWRTLRRALLRRMILRIVPHRS